MKLRADVCALPCYVFWEVNYQSLLRYESDVRLHTSRVKCNSCILEKSEASKPCR